METGFYNAPSHGSFVNLASFNRYSCGDTVTVEIARHWDKQGLEWLRDKLGEMIEELDKPRIPTHAVFNGEVPGTSLESGRLYPIIEWDGSSFEVIKPDGGTLFCLVKGCAHIYPAQWTLVYSD